MDVIGKIFITFIIFENIINHKKYTNINIIL